MESQSSGRWEQLADMPTGVSATGRTGAVLNGKMYSFGGILTDVNKPESQDREQVDTVWIFDPSASESGSWKKGSPMPQKLAGAAAAAAKGKIYLFGGAKPGGGPWNGQDTLANKIYRFDPNGSPEWKDVTPPDGLPQGGLYAASAVYSQQTDRIYVVAGGMGDPKPPNSQRIWTFKPEENEIANPNWATLPADLAARWGSAAILSTGGSKYLHAFGGIHYSPGGTLEKHVRYELSVGESSEEVMSPLPHSGGKLASAVINDRLYVTLGLYDESGDWSISDFKNHMMMYTPALDSWSTDLPEISEGRVRDPGATGVIDGSMYIAGGHLKEYEGDSRDFPNAPAGDHIVKPWTDGFHAGRRPDNVLEITGSGTRTDYSFTVDSNLTGAGSFDSGQDEIVNQGQSASGTVVSGTDAYTFDGDLRAFTFDGGGINVLLNGQPAHVGQRPDHLLEINGTGTYTTYSFTVDNNLEGAGTLDSGQDEITNHNQSASGAVSGGTDAYTFDGDLLAFDFDGKVNVLLDGESAHVGQLPDHV
ncbi:Kelch repeat-containing protein [Haladaptatus cibarius]|uniref:Kelch repeat-containing protein n=1 Tax=Haladaptatus cibarius TaxID=453847 RepID=UPI0006786437|nr:kelch repeat-containing protein [Haladaptatus cibarius]